MNTLQQFLNKLETIKFNDVNGKTLTSAEGWSFTLSTEFHGSNFMPVQVVARVRLNNVVASHWGASCDEDNKTLVHWFIKNESLIYSEEYDIKREQEKTAKDLFNKL